MTLDEREQASEIVRSNWPGRQFVNISSCNVEDSLRLLSHSQQVKEHLKVYIINITLSRYKLAPNSLCDFEKQIWLLSTISMAWPIARFAS